MIGNIKNWVNKVRSYKRVFKKDDADVKTVLIDLGKFAPVDPTRKLTKPYDNNEVYIYIGRRQVLSYLLGKISMTDSELNNLIKQEEAKKQEELNI